MKTGRLLDVLSGHEGPIYGLSFSPTHVSVLLKPGICGAPSWIESLNGSGSVPKFCGAQSACRVPNGRNNGIAGAGNLYGRCRRQNQSAQSMLQVLLDTMNQARALKCSCERNCQIDKHVELK
jgi:hypothetical protein